jgi:uncharacterized protein (DUF885 family)
MSPYWEQGEQAKLFLGQAKKFIGINKFAKVKTALKEALNILGSDLSKIDQRRQKMERSNDFIVLRDVDIVKNFNRLGKRVKHILPAIEKKLPKNCYFKSKLEARRLTALVTRILHQTKQDTIGQEQICAQCPITECEHK